MRANGNETKSPIKIMKKNIPTVLMIIALLFPTVSANADPGLPTKNGAIADPMPSNGIYVSDAKIYDVQTLSFIIELTQSRLTNINPFDQSSLISALGRFQGGTASTSSNSLQATTLPTPQVVQTTEVSGDPPTTATKREVTTNSVTPAQSSISPPDIRFSGSSLPFGDSASGILTEQTALAAEIDALRLLRDRALTDRASLSRIGNTAFQGERQQVVLGFDINLSPLKQFKKALAEVEVTVALKDGQPAPLSLVAVMPETKAYNVATASSKTNGFGFGAVFSPILNIGASSNQTKEALYLVRDIDTVAWETTPITNSAGKPGLRFGWQFRPTLGRQLVEAGRRHVFAVIALPPSLADSNDVKPNFTINVRTYWREYDAKKGALGNILSKSKVEYAKEPLTVPTLAEREKMLSPEITAVRWTETGGGVTLVEVDGQRFVPGTGVLSGDVPLGASNGFSIQGNRRIQFILKAADMASKPLLMIGREGAVQPIESPEAPKASVTASDVPGLKISSVTPKPEDEEFPGGSKDPGSTEREVRINLTRRYPSAAKDETPWFASQEDSESGVPHRHILITYGDQVFTYGSGRIRFLPSDGKTSTIVLTVPVELMRRARLLKVSVPFRGESYTDVFLLQSSLDFTATNAAILTENSEGTFYGIQGSNFRAEDITVTVGRNDYRVTKNHPLEVLDPTLMRLFLTPQQTRGLKQVLVRQGRMTIPVILPVAKAKPSPEPKFHTLPDIYIGDETEIKLTGTELGSIEKITYLDGDTDFIDFSVSTDGTELKLEATKLLKELRRSAGSKPLVLLLKDGNKVPLTITVKERPTKT